MKIERIEGKITLEIKFNCELKFANEVIATLTYYLTASLPLRHSNTIHTKSLRKSSVEDR
jgi:hypothetical protein